ncbi:hypothetical protein ACA910_018781 [Epithemia clementina (nom. ined.)]
MPSALLHKWCHYLAKDCIYEGRGGVKFVRVAPGSMLQLLWPCSKYSPDACLWCGGNFQDHLKLNWFRHLYTPLDQWLDETLEQGLTRIRIPTTTTTIITSSTATNTIHGNKNKKRNKTKQRTTPSTTITTTTTTRPLLVFHRRYVQDGLDLDAVEDENNNNKSNRKRRNIHNKQKRNQNDPKITKQWRISSGFPRHHHYRDHHQILHNHQIQGGIPYTVPSLEQRQQSSSSSSSRRQEQEQQPEPNASLGTSLALTFAYYVVLETLDHWMRIESMENRYPSSTTFAAAK